MKRVTGSAHMMSKAVISGAIAAILASGCLKLDPFLFKGKEVAEYRFDFYTGEGECVDAIDSLGGINPSYIHEMRLSSGSDSIAAVLVASAAAFDSTDTLVLYFHGTGPHIDYYWARTRLLAAAGFPVLTIDYRGYGTSTGKPTETGIYEDGRAAMRCIREMLGNPRVVVYGYSLGTLVACEIAANDPDGGIVALVLEGPIGKLETLVQDAAYIDLPGSYVITYEGNNREKIRNVFVPLLWLHGTDDETNTYETNGKKLYENYPGEQGFCCIVEGANHRTVPSTIGYSAYIGGIGDFIHGSAAANPLFAREPD